jgi:peroxiredoxin
MTNLAQQLDAFKSAWIDRVGPEIAGTIAGDIARQHADAITAKARREDNMFPGLVLPDQLGRPVDLTAVSAAGPLVLVFYRGGWCPYCNLELRAYQQMLPTIEAAGARLIAVSPETPDHTLDTAQKNDLKFDVLSDVEGRLADALGIRFQLSPPIRALYEKFGHNLPDHNGDGQWSLPMPATYVVEKGGRIAFAYADPDYRTRAEPEAALAALRRIAPVAA